MLLRVSALVRTQHGLITRRQLREAGLDDRQVRRLLGRGVLLPLRRGVYVERDRWDCLEPYREQPVLRIRAARLTLGGDYVLSHDSAAIVQGLGAPDPTRALVHVTRAKVHGEAVRAGVSATSRRTRRTRFGCVDGLPVLDPAGRRSTWHASTDWWPASPAPTPRSARGPRSRSSWGPGPGLVLAVQLGDGRDAGPRRPGRGELAGVRGEGAGLRSGDRAAADAVRPDRRPPHGLVRPPGRATLLRDRRALKYDDDNLSYRPPREVLVAEKRRHDFVTGFKLGGSRITAHDCRGGRRAAEARLLREYTDTCAGSAPTSATWRRTSCGVPADPPVPAVTPAAGPTRAPTCL